MYFNTPLLDVDSQRSTSSHKFKVGIALIGGSCLVLLGVVAISAYGSTLQNTNAAESTSLIGMPTSLRAASPMTMLRNIPGGGPFKDLTIAAIEGSNRCGGRDVAVNAGLNSNEAKAVMASMSSEDKAVVAKASTMVRATAQDVLKSGVTAPLGFFDPQGFSTDISEGRLMFFREAELKHGRVCMLAFLGIAVGENYHPLFGGNIDIPAAGHFTLSGGDAFWVAAWAQFMTAAYFEEKRTFFPLLEGRAFSGFNPNQNSQEAFAVKTGRLAGDLGFDPLGLKPKTTLAWEEIQNKELNNGRLAMIGVVGVIAQELVTGEKVFR